jgi:hypothetical protein
MRRWYAESTPQQSLPGAATYRSVSSREHHSTAGRRF